jgi:hypothetical protein
MSGLRGDLNVSTQHLLKVHLPELQKLKSFARVESNETLSCLGLSEYRLTDQFSRGTIVGSAD